MLRESEERRPSRRRGVPSFGKMITVWHLARRPCLSLDAQGKAYYDAYAYSYGRVVHDRNAADDHETKTYGTEP